MTFLQEVEEEEEGEESEEDAMERIKNEINDQFDNDVNKQAIVAESVAEANIPVFKINAGRKPHITRYQISKKLKPIMDCRDSVFERSYAVPQTVAEHMLRAGYARLSRFGKWDPVALHNAEPFQPLHDPTHVLFPAMYRSALYYFASTANRDQFALNPLCYLKQKTPKPVVPIRLSILGPPKAGKSTCMCIYCVKIELTCF